MFRDTVEVRDAVVAITLVDCSNQNQPILRELQGVAQSTFPDNPDEAYARQEHLVLRSLGLVDGADPVPPSPPSSPPAVPAQADAQQQQPQQRPLKAAPVVPQSVQQSPVAASSGAVPVTTTQLEEEALSAGPRDFAQHSPLSNDRWWRAQAVPLTGSQLSSVLPLGAAVGAAAIIPSSQRRGAFADESAAAPPDVVASNTTATKRPLTDVPSAATLTTAKTPRLEKLSPPTGATAAKAAASLLDNIDALDMADVGGDVLLGEPTAAAAAPQPKRGKFLED